MQRQRRQLLRSRSTLPCPPPYTHTHRVPLKSFLQLMYTSCREISAACGAAREKALCCPLCNGGLLSLLHYARKTREIAITEAAARRSCR